MQKKAARSLSGMTRSYSFSAALLSLVLIGASAAHAQDAPVAPETEARGSDEAGIEPRDVDDSALRRGQPVHVEDSDGDGLPDAAAEVSPSVRGRAGAVKPQVQRHGTDSDPTAEPVPALDPNPVL